MIKRCTKQKENMVSKPQSLDRKSHTFNVFSLKISDAEKRHSRWSFGKVAKGQEFPVTDRRRVDLLNPFVNSQKGTDAEEGRPSVKTYSGFRVSF